MKYLLPILALTACAKNPELNLEFAGAENKFYQTERKAFNGVAAIENSFVEINNEVVAFFDPDASGAMDRKDASGIKRVMPNGARFSYVTKIDGRLFNFVTKGAIYRLESFDGGLTWADEIKLIEQNFAQWNVGVAKHNGTWHMLIEADDSNLPDQRGVACHYWTSADGLTWTNTGNRIPNCGNPFLVATTNGVLAIHGVAWRPNVWHVSASTLDNGTWTEHSDKFQIAVPNVHVCDPHAIEKDGKILLSVSVDQNSITLAEAKDSFESMYERMRQ